MDLQLLNDNYESNHESLCFFDYNESNIRVYGTAEAPLFMAKDVAEALGYKDTRKAVQNNVDKEDQLQYQNSSGTDSPSSTIHPHSTLINESGLYCLILRSKKPEAKKFRRWVTSVVLPSIRRRGCYDTPQDNKISPVESYMRVLESATSLFERLGFSDRDKLFIRSLAMNTLTNNVGRNIEMSKENSEWSISRRLSEHFGITDKNAHKKVGTFGKVMAKHYRDNNEEEPPKREQYVNGTVRLVNTYYLDQWESVYDDLMVDYFSEWLEYAEEEE